MRRINTFSYVFSDIALDNYYKAKEHFQSIEKLPKDYEQERYEAHYLMEKNVMITCVFSVMAIESYLNSYAAHQLGDDEFYDNFDKLTILGKLQLIVKFILKTDIDKSSSYYCDLKSMIKSRNSFVHNKSIEFNEKNIKKLFSKMNFKEDYECDYDIAKTAIRGLVGIAQFFERIDTDSHAKFLLLGISYDNNPYCEALKDLGISL